MGEIAAIAIVIGFLWRLGFRRTTTQRVVVLPYQRGVKFTDGRFAGVLPPGQYRIHPNSHRIDLVDLRPQPFLLESLLCKDKLDRRVILSLAGEFAVSDPHLSLISCRNNSADGTARISKAARDTVSNVVVRDTSDTTIALLHTALVEKLRQDLTQMGLQASNVVITELWTAAAQDAKQVLMQ